MKEKRMGYLQLTEKISEIISLEKEDHELLETMFRPLKAKKKEILVEMGKTNRQAFFVNSGYLRYFTVLESGEEVIIHLYAPNTFAASLESFFSGMPAEGYIETITECDLWVISNSDLEKLYSTSQKWQYFGRKLMESFLIEKEQRIIDQLSLSGREKYMKLLQSHPEIIQHVQVQYLASFLGLKPESLSRIRKQII
ncbi:Crp/Fnr family transcriptional regulator [Balneolaceae bacterium ANBcel3]|nr:Crp/Fnr family transcriptional regulator [Balneolaceae bacterium ANBcel3]